MNKVNKKEYGFTLLEVVIVLAIAGIFLGISAGVYFSLQQNNVVNNESRKALSVVRLAQSKTLAARNLSQHGVYFDQTNNNIIAFEGDEYDSSDSSNEVTSLDSRMEIFNIQLDGSTSTVVFNRISGNTENFGFVEFAEVDDPENTAILCIRDTGAIFLFFEDEGGNNCIDPRFSHVSGSGSDDIIFFPDTLAQGDPGQSFTTDSASTSISAAELQLSYNDDNLNSNFSDLYLEIRENSTVGDVLGFSRIISGSSVPSSELSWIRFIFPLPIELDANTQYFMRLRSLPNSNDSGSGAEPSIVWGYDEAGGYAEGSAWRHIAANSNSSDIGEQLSDRDFKFKLHSAEAPTSSDSRHLEFNTGLNLNDYTEIILEFDGGSVTETITIADFMNGSLTDFDWEGGVEVNSESQNLRIHSLYIDDNDTVLSVHRDRRINDAPLTIYLDTEELVSYTADGIPTKGSNIDAMVRR